MRLALARALFVKVCWGYAVLGQSITNASLHSQLFCCWMSLPITVRIYLYLSSNPGLKLLNTVDLNALAWLEDYLQTWPGTLLVV